MSTRIVISVEQPKAPQPEPQPGRPATKSQYPLLQALDKGVDLVLAGFVVFGAVALTLMSIVVMMIVMITRSGSGRH